MDCAAQSLQAKVCVGHAHADSRPDSRAEKGSCKHPYLSTHLKMLRATGPQSQFSHAHVHFCKAGAGSRQWRSCAARMMQPPILTSATHSVFAHLPVAGVTAYLCVLGA